jgi:hypothetical protein
MLAPYASPEFLLSITVAMLKPCSLAVNAENLPQTSQPILLHLENLLACNSMALDGD